VKDLAIGDLIRVDGFEEDQIVRKAKQIDKGLDAGLLEITLAAADGETERMPAAVVVPAPQAAAPPAAPAKAKTSKQARGRNQAARQKPLSCLDAAAKVLTETGQALSCPQLIAAMAAQGSWTSPAGKTPAATLYAAILREIRTKKDQARFCKTGPGRFARA
jgi:hypothetical protein